MLLAGIFTPIRKITYSLSCALLDASTVSCGRSGTFSLLDVCSCFVVEYTW
jgi:hypothetical protein